MKVVSNNRIVSLSHVPLFVTLLTKVHQDLLSMEFSRQEYWSGCHSLLQEIFPPQGTTEQIHTIIYCGLYPQWDFLMAETVRHLPQCRRPQVRSFGWEDPLENEMAPTPVLLLENSMDGGAWWATVQGLQRVGHD